MLSGARDHVDEMLVHGSNIIDLLLATKVYIWASKEDVQVYLFIYSPYTVHAHIDTFDHHKIEIMLKK